MKNFYKAFEDRCRGSRGLIKSRLEVYLPFILPFKTIEKSPKAIDLGCGRGEWLELLVENGFDTYGVDLDDGMLAVCVQLGLKIESNDVIAYLNSQPDQSIYIVSGFHIAEHLPFEVLQTLVSEALRVLKPGGILILETPNPENILVGSNTFYLDPTHERPIPPELLSFLIEYTGFFRVKIVRLQEEKDLATNEYLSLMNVLSGVSQDYSVVAQKQSEPSLMAQFDSIFNHEYGITLDFLGYKYDRQFENKFELLNQRLNEVYQSTWPLRQAMRGVKWVLSFIR